MPMVEVSNGGTLEKIEFNGTTTFTTDSSTKLVLFLGGANAALAWDYTYNGIDLMAGSDSGVSYFSGYSATRVSVFKVNSPATNTISPGQYGSASNPGIVYLIKE